MINLPPPPYIITDWKCKDFQFGKWCERMEGSIKYIRVVQESDADNAYQFSLPDVDDSFKVSDGIKGMSRIVGWPSWCPIFNRKRVYNFAYPVTPKQKKKFLRERNGTIKSLEKMNKPTAREWDIAKVTAAECFSDEGYWAKVIEKTPHVEKCINMHDELVTTLKMFREACPAIIAPDGWQPDWSKKLDALLLKAEAE